MTNKQNNVYSMLHRVLAFLKKNLALFSELTALVELTTGLENLLAEIDSLKEQQGTDITGLSRQKETLRAVAAQKGLEVSHGILAFAKISGNEVLANEVNFNDTDFKRCSDTDLDTILSVIYSAALKYQTQVTGYGVTEEKITSFKSAMDAFKTAINNPKDARIAHGQVTDRLSVAFDDALALVDKVGLLMDTFKYSNPSLYSEFQANRRIFSRAGSLTAKVHVTDAATGLGLAGVRVVFVLDGMPKLDKTTAEGGGFSIKSLDEGIYTVTLSKIGYIAQTLTVNISDTELNSLEVALVKG